MFLTLTVPPSINQTYKTNTAGSFYKSSKVKEWMDMSLWTIKTQCGALHELTEPCYVGLEFFFKRDRDIDSGIKSTLDLLQKARLIKNDSDIVNLNVKKYSSNKPRLEVTIEPTK